MLRYRSNVFLSYQEKKKKKQEKKRNLPFLLSSLCNKVGTRIQFVAAADIGFISSEKVPTFEDNWIRCCASGKETSIEYRRVFQSWFVNKCVNGGIIFFSRRSSIRCLEFQRVRLESFLPGSVKESLRLFIPYWKWIEMLRFQLPLAHYTIYVERSFIYTIN